MGRNVAEGDRGDVSMRWFPVIRNVRALSESVPLGGEHTLTSRGFNAEASATDTCEEVDKRERRARHDTDPLKGVDTLYGVTDREHCMESRIGRYDEEA